MSKRYTPRSEQWTRRSDMPACCMAGTGLALGNDELLIVGGADGSLFDQAMYSRTSIQVFLQLTL